MKRLWLVAAVLLAVAQSAPAQDLGEAAAKEKARRKKVAGSPTVYTNEDLDKGKPPPSPSPSPTAAPAPPAAGAPSARGRPGRRVGGGVNPPAPASTREVRPETETEGEGPSGPPGPTSAGAETYWRARAQALRKTVSDTETQISALEKRIQELQLDRDPNAPDMMDPNRLQKRDSERLKAIDEVERAKATLDAARKAVSDFQEEARRKGVPPSWIE
jgi:hypothetical protein